MANTTNSRTVIRALILPLYLPMVFLSAGMAAPIPGFPQYLSGLGASVGLIGLIISLRGVGNIIADIPGGLIIQRLGVRSVVLAFFTISTAMAAVIALVPVLWVIAIAKVLMGLSNAVITLGMMAYVRQTVVSAHRGRALSLAGGSLRIGMLVGPFVGGLLAEAVGVPAAFAFQAVVTFLGFVLVAVGLEPLRRGSPAPASPTTPAAAGGGTDARTAPAGAAQGSTIDRLREGLKGQAFKLSTVGFAIFTLMLLRAARQIIMPLWGDALGLSPAIIGQVMSASAAVELLVVLPAGHVMDRAGRKVAASLCTGIFAAGVMLLPLSGAALGFLLIGLVIGIGNGFGSGINMTIGTDLAPDQAIGEFLGLWRLFGDVGAAIGPSVVGAVAAALTLPAALLVTGGIGMLGVFVMAFIAPETRRDGPAEV
jgi:MFS family permease